MRVEVRLFATLRDYAPKEATAGVFSTELPEGATLDTLLAELRIATEKIHLRMVNGAGAEDSHILKDNDRVGLFPPVGGG